MFYTFSIIRGAFTSEILSRGESGIKSWAMNVSASQRTCDLMSSLESFSVCCYLSEMPTSQTSSAATCKSPKLLAESAQDTGSSSTDTML